jgi:hypothetical protein
MRKTINLLQRKNLAILPEVNYHEYKKKYPGKHTTKQLLFLIAGILILTGFFVIGNHFKQTPRSVYTSNQTNYPTPQQKTIHESPDKWKTYQNLKLDFSLQYPTEMRISSEEVYNVASKNWSIHFTTAPKSEIEKEFANTTTPYFLKTQHYYDKAYYTISIEVENDPQFKPRYEKSEPLTIANLSSVFMTKPPVNYSKFNGKPSVSTQSTFASGKHTSQIGGTISYYVLDKNRSIHLTGTSHNLQEIPITALDKILSTFTILDQAENSNKDTWQTYRNPTYNYSIQYPTGWTLTEENVLKPHVARQEFRGEEVTFSISLQKQRVTWEQLDQMSNPNELQHLTIDGLSGTLSELPNTGVAGASYRLDFIAEKNGITYWFNMVTTLENEKLARDLFPQILSTFTFTK